ncbi:MAG: diacylglycerol kinase [Alcaligenaceae bacterium]|nr:diacylglycerol kinase [Alcaligenaceae bacterium]
MHSPYKSKGGFSRLLNALRYSIRGLLAAFRHEAAFRQELILAVVLVPVALWIGQNAFEITLLIGSLLFVLLIELLNSALETLADTITTQHHPMIGKAKDLGSAAVLLALIMALLIWLGIILT